MLHNDRTRNLIDDSIQKKGADEHIMLTEDHLKQPLYTQQEHNSRTPKVNVELVDHNDD